MTTFEPEFPSTFSQQNSPHHLVSTRSGKVTLSVPNRKDNQMENESQRGNQNRTLDRSSFSIARNLAEIKEKRKLMESNAQLLFNRLQALSSEEYKLKRNTLDLKKKSQELLKHRLSRDKQKNREQQDLNEREKLKARDYDQVRQVVLESKEKAKQEAERIKKLIEEKKRREAQEIRKQRLENEEKIIQAKNQHIQAQKVRSLKVKQAESSSALKIKEYHSVKAELMREEREKMVREEEERILQKEREVQKLSMREDAMLEALYKAQDSENTALTEYEEISKLPLDEVASKYTYYLKTDNGGLSSKKWPSDTSPRGKSMSFVSGSFIQPKSAKLLPLTLKSQEVMKQSYLSN